MDTNTIIDSFKNYLIPFLDKTGMKFDKVIMNGAKSHTA